MKLIKSSFEIIPQLERLDGLYQIIEVAGRTCYKSNPQYEYFDLTDRPNEPIERYVNCEINISKEEAFDRKLVIRRPTTAKEFVEKMIKSNHVAMLEHGTVYLTYPVENSGSPSYLGIGVKYRENKYSKVNYDTWGTRYITTNYRVLVENNWLDDLQYLCEPTEYHEKRTTVKFIMDRIGSQSFCRHRVFSFAQESTRYCNYSKDKFDNNITFIAPNWLDSLQLGNHDSLKICNDFYKIPIEQEFHSGELQEIMYLVSLAMAEVSYLKLIETGWQAQQARSVLPNSLKTEIVMTGFDSDWEHFFELRTPASAHPQARELAIPLQKEMNKIK